MPDFPHPYTELGGLGAAVTHHTTVAGDGDVLLHNLPSLRGMAKKDKQIADSRV